MNNDELLDAIRERISMEISTCRDGLEHVESWIDGSESWKIGSLKKRFDGLLSTLRAYRALED